MIIIMLMVRSWVDFCGLLYPCGPQELKSIPQGCEKIAARSLKQKISSFQIVFRPEMVYWKTLKCLFFRFKIRKYLKDSKKMWFFDRKYLQDAFELRKVGSRARKYVRDDFDYQKLKIRNFVKSSSHLSWASEVKEILSRRVIMAATWKHMRRTDAARRAKTPGNRRGPHSGAVS